MGRALLILCVGAFIVTALAARTSHRTLSAQDGRLSAHEADVVARENALSALNEVVPFVADHFDALTSGQAVDVSHLSAEPVTLVSGAAKDNLNCGSEADRYNTDAAYRARNVWGRWKSDVSAGPVTAAEVCRRFAGRRSVRLAPGRQAKLVGQQLATLMPTRELATNSSADAAVRAQAGGRIEVVATGTYVATAADGTLQPRSVTVRRVYAKASVLDAALIALAPSITPSFSGDYRFDGRDVTSGGTPSGNVARYRNAVKTNAALVAQRIGAVAGAANAPRFMGVNGPGDIVSGSLVADVEAIFDEAYVHPSRQIVSATLGTTTLGSTTAPVIAVAQDGLTVTGTLRGTGILVVNGDLTTSGTGKLLWDGVVMVRKDGAAMGSAGNLSVRLSRGSQVSGSLVVSQGATAFAMPFDGRIKVNYLGSGTATYPAAVGIEHTRGGQATQQEIIPPDTPRGGPAAPYNVDLKAGDQINFFINVYYPSFYPDSKMVGQFAYRNYSRGHFDPVANMPYGLSEQMGAYRWKVLFEDMRQGIDLGSGLVPDFDFYVPGGADQEIEVTLQCRQYDRDGNLLTSFGQPVYEDCTPANPDTHVQETPLNWSTLTASSGLVASPEPGTNLHLTVDGAKIYHNTQAISRLAPLLQSLRERSQLVLLSTWTGT